MRRLVQNFSTRCPACRLPDRWCVCAAGETTACGLGIDVLMHHREVYRPSSTGNLIPRILPAARLPLWRRERRLAAGEIRTPGRELWILHPQGTPLAAEALPAPETVQVVLLDGSWREASAMVRETVGWGRLVNLPMTGESRFRLRAQGEAGRFSTVEALLALLAAFGLDAAHAVLNRQFELHLYASLRSRGRKDEATAFLETSRVLAPLAPVIAQMDASRPRVETMRPPRE